MGWWDPHLLGFNESVLRAFVQTQRHRERERGRKRYIQKVWRIEIVVVVRERERERVSRGSSVVAFL